MTSAKSCVSRGLIALIRSATLRDINAAAQHQMVSGAAYENHGQFVLGLPEADPMG